MIRKAKAVWRGTGRSTSSVKDMMLRKSPLVARIGRKLSSNQIEALASDRSIVE